MDGLGKREGESGFLFSFLLFRFRSLESSNAWIDPALCEFWYTSLQDPDLCCVLGGKLVPLKVEVVLSVMVEREIVDVGEKKR